MKNRFSGIKVVMGLGNPESGYKNTYHNAGKLLVDYLSEKLVSAGETKTINFRKKSSGDFESRVSNGLSLVKPVNYMNENGKAAKAALKYFGAKPDSLLAAHDDSDIEIGKYKISFGSGPAGHNGVRSVIDSIGTKDFWRLRIGIRKKETRNERQQARMKAIDFVLKKITVKDKELMNSVFDAAIKEIFGE
ncbi:MAG TPA: aminoacyl-tRNA hydrolase [Candidatus Paceibacterota bacterium]|nr:aminoacyl-tRNA hydrolase [Candidatus Paceibacterota bacterium]